MVKVRLSAGPFSCTTTACGAHAREEERVRGKQGGSLSAQSREAPLLYGSAGHKERPAAARACCCRECRLQWRASGKHGQAGRPGHAVRRWRGQAASKHVRDDVGGCRHRCRGKPSQAPLTSHHPLRQCAMRPRTCPSVHATAHLSHTPLPSPSPHLSRPARSNPRLVASPARARLLALPRLVSTRHPESAAVGSEVCMLPHPMLTQRARPKHAPPPHCCARETSQPPMSGGPIGGGWPNCCWQAFASWAGWYCGPRVGGPSDGTSFTPPSWSQEPTTCCGGHRWRRRPSGRRGCGAWRWSRT